MHPQPLITSAEKGFLFFLFFFGAVQRSSKQPPASVCVGGGRGREGLKAEMLVMLLVLL